MYPVYARLLNQVKDPGFPDRHPGFYLRRIALTAGLFAAGWAAFVLIGDSWWQLAVAVFLAFVFTRIAFVGHEAGHRQISASRRVNDLIGLAYADLAIGLSFGWWADQHDRRQAHPSPPGEGPDIEGDADGQRPAAPMRHGHPAYLIVPLLLLEGLNVRLAGLRALAAGRVTRYRTWETALLAVHAVAYLGAVFLVLSPVKALGFIAVQQGLFGLYLGYSFAPAPDDRDDFVRRQVPASRNVRGEPPAPAPFGPARTECRVTIGGRAVAYTSAGAGKPLLLVHGLGGTRQTWNNILDALAETHTVIAPDLPGHGESDPPAGDFSLGAFAVTLRDLLVSLNLRSATIIGHSLGGGIAMQFAYQFPERTDRLVLISSGGLGPQVSPMLRAATLPGAETVVAVLARSPEAATRRILSFAARVMPGSLARPDIGPVAEDLHRLTHGGQRRTFVRTARNVIDWRGQSISATENLAQLSDLPILLAWGTDDRTIPPYHHPAVAGLLTCPRLLEIPGAGHYPHVSAPDELVPALREFLASTKPFRYTEARWRHLLTAALRR